MDLPADATAGPLSPERTLPLLVRPDQAGADASAWAAAHRPWIESALQRHGALLLRGFKVDGVARFGQLVRAVSPEPPQLDEESSPRTLLADGVYTSTDHPPAHPIQFHNEYSYSASWPMKLFFCCLLPAARGGETPIADSRRVLARLRPETVERFRRLQVLYARNYAPGMGVPWQTAFQTKDRAAVEAYCRRAGIQAEWRGENVLRTRQLGEAILRHPGTGEEVWFNHGFFFNVLALEPREVRQAMLDACPEEELSTQTFFGDGSPIGEAIIEELREAYRQEASAFPWSRGDVLLIDNMLTAHSRTPYSGPRKVVVAMTEARRRQEQREP